MLSSLDAPNPPPTKTLGHLQAMVVSPNEKALIFVETAWTTWSGRRSSIYVAPIQHRNGHSLVGDVQQETSLNKALSNPSKCAVAVDYANINDDWTTLLIAHSDGTFESKPVRLSIRQPQ